MTDNGNGVATAPVQGDDESNITIGTHSGTFHCDEALACYLLRLTDQFKGAKIVRTRDPEVLSTLPVIVDVGGVYDHSKCRYDHHQRGFTETFSPDHFIKLSSAGLVYKHYGREIIKKLTDANDDDVETLYEKMYTSFVEALDAVDNGVEQYDKNMRPKYSVTTSLPSRVSYLNPMWNETVDDSGMLERFHQAMNLAGSEFVQQLTRAYKSWLPARDIVRQSILKRFDYDSSGKVVVLDRFVTWQSHLSDLEQEMKLDTPLLYVIYADSSQKWRVQAVAQAVGSFKSRLALPEDWRGVRDDELSKLTGIPGCIFVHASGFIGGNETFDGVLEMARKSISIQTK